MDTTPDARTPVRGLWACAVSPVRGYADRHAIGNHTQVLTAYQHSGGLCQLRQLVHSLLAPELVVAVVVVVVVQAVEGRFLPIIQGAVHIVVLHADTGMIFVRVVAVGYKQYVADERIQTVAHPNAVFVRLAGKVGFYLALSVKFRTHPVDFPRVRRFDEGLLHVVGVRTEHLSEEIFVYIRFQELIAEG